jgi:ABC-type polysaccharide/polyol phosphate export permease
MSALGTDKETSDKKSSAYSVSPPSGGAFAVALGDIRAAARMAPMWIHTGWIGVVWRYRRTRLGPFWHTLSLAAFVIVMGVIWSKALNADPVQHFRYVGTSLIVWSLIASQITGATSIIISEKSTALSMRTPYIAFALKHVWSSLLLFAHHMILYVAIMVGSLKFPGWSLLLLAPALLLILANGVWMSLIVGMICLSKRDFIPMISSAMQIMMFVTPIFWTKDRFGAEIARMTDFNPLYHFVSILRMPMLGNIPPLDSWLWSIGTLAVGSWVTSWIYGRYRDRLAYWY